MKKNEVKVGGVYLAKVTNKVVPVKITSENPSGGYQGLNLKTGKKIKVKSAQRLRGPANSSGKPRPNGDRKNSVATKLKSPKKIVTKAEYEAEAKAELTATGETNPTSATKDTTIAAKHDTGQPAATGGKPDENTKPLSLIKAAVCVLEACERPLNCKEIVAKAMDSKIWAPHNGGLTPANTLSAAIRREIKTKGDASRFTQTERGKFALNS